MQGFLRNERENAILAAIEEARKNVSCTFALFSFLFFFFFFVIIAELETNC